jgi:hypothetical protein
MPSSSPAKSPNTEKSEPTILLSPPLEPTPKSGIDKIKEIFRDERMKAAAELSPTAESDREYGKVVLSPPNGQDGRVANKPRELMTPFERIRFGHTDELFNVNDDSPRRQGSHLFPMKRRNGFIALPMLNRQRTSMGSFARQPQRNQMLRLPPSPQSKFEDSIVILQNGGGGATAGITSSDLSAYAKEGESPKENSQQLRGVEVKDRNEDLVSLLAEYDASNSLYDSQPLLVSPQTLPTS